MYALIRVSFWGENAADESEMIQLHCSLKTYFSTSADYAGTTWRSALRSAGITWRTSPGVTAVLFVASLTKALAVMTRRTPCRRSSLLPPKKPAA